jgi:hypothetical protein
MNTVTNLETGKTRYYSCPPDVAVIAAHAQTKFRDFSTWDYANKYAGLVRTGVYFVTCGDWTCRREPALPTVRRSRTTSANATAARRANACTPLLVQ